MNESYYLFAFTYNDVPTMKENLTIQQQQQQQHLYKDSCKENRTCVCRRVQEQEGLEHYEHTYTNKYLFANDRLSMSE
jgi:hypothetical protein